MSEKEMTKERKALLQSCDVRTCLNLLEAHLRKVIGREGESDEGVRSEIPNVLDEVNSNLAEALGTICRINTFVDKEIVDKLL